MSKTESVGEASAAVARRRLDRLYRLHSPWLTARIRRRFGADAEDVVQEAWLRLAPFEILSDIRHPKAFLLKVASNLAINRAVQSRRRRELLETAVPLQPPGQDAEQFDALRMQEVLMGLPQPLRDVFLLSRLGGLTNGQIAEQLGLSPKTVEWRMTRALAFCAAQLRQ